MKIYSKIIEIPMIEINGIKFDARDLFRALNELNQTESTDRYGDYSLRDYELSCDYETIEGLVTLGYAFTFMGERQAKLYKKCEEAKFDNFLEVVEKMLVEWESNRKAKCIES